MTRRCWRLLELVAEEIAEGLMSPEEGRDYLENNYSPTTTRMGHLCKSCRQHKWYRRHMRRQHKCLTDRELMNYARPRRSWSKAIYHQRNR